ncbi:MAG: hypothetical protein KY432_11955 [Acidobacteria bacterium]|nr:hypothetical protein [Acidobacteriota bacterium]
MHLQCVVDAVEVIEETGRGRDLDDLSFIVMLPQSIEQCVVDQMCIERKLLCESECCSLLFVERTVFKVQQTIQLLFRSSEPRNLRGM